jgi:Fis family transcriptional regulator, factor for inversion stimulation protein
MASREQSAPWGTGSASSLSLAVDDAVGNYLAVMDDQPVTDLYDLVLAQIEAALFERVLRHTQKNHSQAALILGLNRGTLRKKLKKHGMM